MFRDAVRRAAPSIALALLVLLPFGGKAFTIDDALFMEQATHLLADPLHATAFETVWSESAVPKRMSQIMPSGPVAAWVLAPAAGAGGSEWLAHLTQLGLLVLAVVATVALALRVGMAPRSAAVAGLLLAATPAVLGMAGTAMPDMAAMALGVAGLERLVAWKHERRARHAVVAALLLGLAPLARSHLLLVPGIGALLLAGSFLATASWRDEPLRTWAPVLCAPLVTAVVAVVTRDPAGGAGDLASSARTFSGAQYLATNTVAFATHWVLALPLAVPWIVLRGRRVAGRWWVLVGAALAAGLALATWHPGTRWLFAIAATAGVGTTVLIDVLADAWERVDSLQLALGLWLLVPLPVAIYLHMPSKYLLASAPAVALLVARALDRAPERLRRRTIAVVVAVGVATGVAILRADARFAGLGRRAAAELIAPNVAAGHRVWFAGNWGFKWYATAAGGRILTLTPPYPAPGDLVVTTRNSEPGYPVLRMLQERYPALTVVAQLEDREPGGRVMDAQVGAGFFSNAWGYLPWAWGNDTLDSFALWRIEQRSASTVRD